MCKTFLFYKIDINLLIVKICQSLNQSLLLQPRSCLVRNSSERVMKLTKKFEASKRLVNI